MSLSVANAIIAILPPFMRKYASRVKASPIRYRLARGVFWSMAGAVISRGLMLVATVCVARLLGKTVYGELGMIQSTVGMFGVFAGFGLGLTATKHVAEFRKSDPLRAGRILGLSGVVAIVSGGLIALGVLLSAPWLAEHTINAPHLSGPLRIGALILFISALNGAQTGALSGFEAFKTIARVNLLVGLLSFPMLIAGAWFGGLTGTVWAIAINLVFNWLLNHLAVRKEAARHGVPFRFTGCGQEWSVLWRFSLPAVLAAVLVGPVNWSCRALLVNQPGGYGEMGIYSVAYQWLGAILFLPGMLSQVALPLLSDLSGASTVRQYRKVLRTNILLSGSAALAVVLPLALVAHAVMLAYGPDYEEGADILRLLALTAVLISVNNIVGSAIISRGKMWVGFAFNVMWAVVLVTATAILLHLGYGAFGLACAMLIAYAFHTVWQALYLRAVLGRMDEGPSPRSLVPEPEAV